MKKIISMILLLVITTLALSSCGKLGIGRPYTGGFSDANLFHQYWWVETFDECAAAIDSLSSYGSTFCETLLLPYDEELFDIKYCFLTNTRKEEQPVGIFVDRFERKVEDISVTCYAFFEDVKLSTLVYSYLSSYTVYEIVIDLEYATACDFNFGEVKADDLVCNVTEIDHDMVYEYRLGESDALVLSLVSSNHKNGQPSNEVVQSIIDSISIDGLVCVSN